jgi:SSS family solute:Na+ symporter
MMTGSANAVWLPLFALLYTAATLYWARVAARENHDTETFFSAGHSLSPWIAALTLSGSAISGWFLLGGATEISIHGFGLPALLEGGIALALPGVFFFKRMWFVAQRLRISSQVELFRVYYRSEFLAAVSASIAVIFAIGFAGLQMRALSHLVALLTNGMISPLQAGFVLSAILFGYVVIGGMRAVGYLGAIQTVLLGGALIGFAGFSLYAMGGFGALNDSLRTLAAGDAAARRFLVQGVIHFTAGLGRDGGTLPTATGIASLGLAMALMGFQASPLAAKIVMSTRSAEGFAAGQTWVLAGVFGAMIAFGVAVVGAAGLVDPHMTVPGLLAGLASTSPWFMAWLVVGLLAGVQLLAGLALISAGEALVRNIYKPWFRSGLSRADTVNVTRVVIGLLALLSVLMQSLTPVTLSALGAVALPLAFQLWTPLLGVTWLRWITRPAAVTGVGFGVAGVLLTEPLGYQILSFLGLELPWGRWPWALHSAAWGMAANLAAVLIISAITNRQDFGEEAVEIRRFLSETLRTGARARTLRSTAWSVVLAWLFLAVGPGLVFGNAAFGEVGAKGGSWYVGMPSIWAWSLLFWALGVAMIWFLAYAMEMASPYRQEIPAYQPRPRLRTDQSAVEGERLRLLFVAGAAAFALVVLIVLGFGG